MFTKRRKYIVPKVQAKLRLISVTMSSKKSVISGIREPFDIIGLRFKMIIKFSP